MAYLEWNDQFNTGISRIDQQHRRLVDFLNDLYAAMHAGKGRDVLGKVLIDLLAYTRTHFTTEEQLMAEHGFPGLEDHKTIHQKMARKVKDLNRQFKSGQIANPIQITNFLKNWLTRHILETDMKYAPHLVGKKIK